MRRGGGSHCECVDGFSHSPVFLITMANSVKSFVERRGER